VTIPVDAAGNEQSDCSGNPLEWQFDIDSEQVDWFAIDLIDPVTGPGYVQIRWPYETADGVNLKLWAKALSTDTYALLPGAPVADEYEQSWVFEDITVPARIRSYKLTDPSGQETLVEFQRMDGPSQVTKSIAPIFMLLLD
jgi:hypothetical protein